MRRRILTEILSLFFCVPIKLRTIHFLIHNCLSSCGSPANSIISFPENLLNSCNIVRTRCILYDYIIKIHKTDCFFLDLFRTGAIQRSIRFVKHSECLSVTVVTSSVASHTSDETEETIMLLKGTFILLLLLLVGLSLTTARPSTKPERHKRVAPLLSILR